MPQISSWKGERKREEEKRTKGKRIKEEKMDFEENEVEKDKRGWEDKRRRERGGSPILRHSGAQSAAVASSGNLPEM